MAEPAARVALPRLRAAWLREIGVEVLWPVAVRQPREPAHQLRPESSGLSDTDASSDAIDVGQRAIPEPSLQSQAASEVAASQPAILSQGQGGDRAESRTQVPWRENAAVLQCRLYAGEEQSEPTCWAVVADEVELHVFRDGPARFLNALMHAVMPGAQVSTVSVPILDEQAVGWLQGDEALTGLATKRCRVILIGAAARRAAGMPTRLGEIGRLNAGSEQFPAVALPPLNDLTASPAGKAQVWRALRALDAAET